MKPAPATSTLATAGLGGSKLTRDSANFRGFWRVALARRMARLLAKSPCCGSRVFSTSTLRLRASAGTWVSGSAAMACASNFSIKVFKANPWLTKGRQFNANLSIHLQRIHIDGPAQAGWAGEAFHPRQPGSEKALQRGPLGGLDQQVRAKVIGPAGDHGAGGAQNSNGRLVQRPAGAQRRAQECVQSAAVLGLGAQHGESRIWGPAGLAPLLQGADRESLIALRQQSVQQGMLRKLRLNQYFAGLCTASRPSGNLRDGLGEALRCAKIAGEQSLFGVQDHHQADLGKVMTLGQHLC